MKTQLPSIFSWRLAAAGLVIISLCLAGISPASAADPISLSTFTTFDDGSYPSGLLYGPDQATWYTLAGSGKLGWFDGSSQGGYPLSNLSSRPLDIAIGADQAVWFTEEDGNQIGRYTGTDGLTEFTLPAANSSPHEMVLGQDQAIWFTEFDNNAIGRITSQGDIREFTLPHLNSKPQSIVSDMDGNLWFTEWNGYRIGKITLQGEITEYAIPTPPARPAELLYGPDGALWLTFNTGKKIARFDTASESFTYHTLATTNAALMDLTIGPDGLVWFLGTQAVGNFAVVNGAPADLIEEALAAPIYSYSGRSQMISGPDNDILFTAANSSVVSKATLAGSAVLRDLQIFITYRPPMLLAAGEFYIDTQINNWTNTTASGMTLDLTLDADIHFVSVDLVGTSCVDSGLTVKCALPDLAAGASVPVRITMNTGRIYEDVVERVLTFRVSSDVEDYLPTNNQVILYTRLQRSWDYYNDFSHGADAFWSNPSTASPVPGLDMLGLFDNDQVTFSVDNLPFHDRIWLCYDLYILGGWDGSQYVADDDITVIGPDLWANYLDDNRLLVTTFSNQARYQQAYPSNYPEALNEDQIGSNAVGEYDGLSTFTDARYRRCLWMDHTKLSMKALFMGLNLDEMEPEKWAIDNVKIKIFFDAVFDKYYLPVVLQ